MPKLNHVLIAVSLVTLALVPKLIHADNQSLGPCDFSSGIPQGVTPAILQMMFYDPQAYLASPNPICNPLIGKGAAVQLPEGYPTPSPSLAPTPTPSASPSPEVLSAASTPAVLPATGGSGR